MPRRRKISQDSRKMHRISVIFLTAIVLLSGCAQNTTPAPDKNPPVQKKYVNDDPVYKQVVSEAGLPIIIAKIWPSKPQGGDGINANLLFENISDKTMQNVFFTLTALDENTMPVYSERGKSDRVRVKFSIEMEPGKVARSTWGPIWPDAPITDIRIDGVRIVYEDNSEATITTTDDLDLMTMPDAFQTEEVPLFQKVD